MQGKLWRRLWHVGGGALIAVLALFMSKVTLLILLAIAAAILVTWEIARFISPSARQWTNSHLGGMLKKDEGFRFTGSTYLLLSSLVVLSSFEKYVAITSVLFVSIGDFAAQVVGEKYGSLRLSGKSLEGSLACLLSCILIGIGMTRVNPILSLSTAAAGATAAAVVEFLPVPLDDNLTIPLISAGVMTVTAQYIG